MKKKGEKKIKKEEKEGIEGNREQMRGIKKGGEIGEGEVEDKNLVWGKIC